jgi:rhodanese-related sulfurtransferase
MSVVAMEQLLEFTSNHLFLVGTFIAILVFLVFGEFKRLTRCYKELSPNEAVMMMNHDEALLLDVREANEVAQGKIKGCKHIPLSSFKQRMNELEEDKGRKIIIYCRSGNRSGQASAMLCKQQYAEVYNLKGGVMAWQSDNLPLVKK